MPMVNLWSEENKSIKDSSSTNNDNEAFDDDIVSITSNYYYNNNCNYDFKAEIICIPCIQFITLNIIVKLFSI